MRNNGFIPLGCRSIQLFFELDDKSGLRSTLKRWSRAAIWLMEIATCYCYSGISCGCSTVLKLL
jgi:hypothetical protein